MANADSTQLQELYVAYFGRAADPTGLDYWTAKGITTTKFAADMYAQAEFKDVYGTLSVEAQVNQIYKNLFDREADVTGLTYWTQQINLGTLKVAEIATHLIWAAQNNSGSSDDKTALTNRTNAAVAYTAEVKGSTAAILAYAPTTSDPWSAGANITEAISYLSGIDKDTAHTAAGVTSSVSTITTNGVQSEVVAGKSYTLTTAQDTITGSGGNDAITGLNTTLTTGDSVDGGAGTDTVSVTQTISAATSLAGFTLKNVEKLTVALADGDTTTAHAVTLNTNNSSASTLEATGQSTTTVSDGVTFTNVASGTKLSLASATDLDLNATYVTSATSGTADSVTLTINGATTTAATDGIVTIATGFETINVATTGSASDIGDLITTSGTTLNVTGDQNLTISADLDATLTTIDASAFTGGLTIGTAVLASGADTTDGNGVDLNDVTITGGTGNDSIDITEYTASMESVVSTGAGNDTVTIGYLPNNATDSLAGDTISGGTGTDTLSTDVDVVDVTTGGLSGITKLTGVSGFEVLKLTGFTTENNTINPENISTDITTISLEAGATGTRTSTINVSGDITVQAKGSALLVDDTIVVDSGSGTSDTLTFKNANAASLAYQIGDAETALTATDFETVIFDTGSNTTTTAQTFDAINIGVLNALEITGSNGLTLTATTGIVTAKTIDASALTGILTMNVAAAEGATTITGGTKSDTLKGDTQTATTISGGAGNDAITGGTGNDILSGGTGNDTITTGAGTDAVTGGTGNDTIVYGANLTSLDTINGGDGTDTLSLTNASLTALESLSISEANTFNTNFTSVENLLVSDALDNTTFDLGYLDSLSKVTLTAYTGNETLSGFDSGDTLDYADGPGTATHILTASVNNSSTGTADVLNVSLSKSADDDYGVLALANVETINIDSTETTASATLRTATIGLTITQATGGAAQTVNFTGLEDITVDTAIAAGTIDASGMTVNVVTDTGLIMSSAHTKAQTITGTGKVDTLYGSTKADTINAGAGVDTIHAGRGGDTIDGGAGADVLHTTGMVAASIDGTGTGTSTGVAINLSSSALTGAAITATHGEYLGGSLASLASNTMSYVFNAQATTNGAAITTIANIDNITLAANGLNYVLGNDSANIITGGTSTDWILGGKGNDTIAGLGGVDTITAGEGEDTITPGVGADVITLTETTAATDTINYSEADNTVTAYDAITGFNAGLTAADKLVDPDAAFDVSADEGTAIAAKGGTTQDTTLTATVSNGMITLAGSGTDDVDNVAEWAGIAAVANVCTAGDTVGFEYSGDTYIFTNMTTNSLIRLVGVTGVTLSDTAAAADTVFMG